MDTMYGKLEDGVWENDFTEHSKQSLCITLQYMLVGRVMQSQILYLDVFPIIFPYGCEEAKTILFPCSDYFLISVYI